jgi:hypothetical protein
MDGPQELANIYEEQETESSRRPSSNPLILVVDSDEIQVNLVDKSMPSKALVAAVPKVRLPCTRMHNVQGGPSAAKVYSPYVILMH